MKSLLQQTLVSEGDHKRLAHNSLWEFFFPFFSFSSLFLKMEIFYNKKWRRRRKFTGCWWCFILFSLLRVGKERNFSFKMPPTRRKRWWTELRWFQGFMRGDDEASEGKFDGWNPWESFKWTLHDFFFISSSLHYFLHLTAISMYFFSSLQSLFLV